VSPVADSRAIDWESIASRLSRSLHRKFQSFRDYRVVGFDPSQRLKWLAFESGVSRLPTGLDPETVLPVVLSRAIVNVKELGPKVVLFGVHKKGMSLLTQLAEMNSFIAGHTIVHDDMETASLVRNKNVLIVDDSIHHGRTCGANVWRLRREGAKEVSVFTAVASRKGLAVLTREGVQVSAVLDAPEPLFTLAFGLVMVPLLGVFRNGALSNRPYRVFRISLPRVDIATGSYNVLSTMSSLRSVRKLSEIPPADDKTAPVFHGSIELSTAKMTELRLRMASIGDQDQVKLRVFLSGDRDALRLCICGIVWPIGRETLNAETVAKGCDDHSKWLLQSIASELNIALQKKGMKMRRIQSLLTWGRRTGASPVSSFL
jgi:hypothetical protein